MLTRQDIMMLNYEQRSLEDKHKTHIYYCSKYFKKLSLVRSQEQLWTFHPFSTRKISIWVKNLMYLLPTSNYDYYVRIWQSLEFFYSYWNWPYIYAQCTFVKSFAWFCFVFVFILPPCLWPPFCDCENPPHTLNVCNLWGGRVLIHYLRQMHQSSASHLPFCTLGHRKVIQARISYCDPLTLDLHFMMPRNRERDFIMAVVEASTVSGTPGEQRQPRQWCYGSEQLKRDSSSVWCPMAMTAGGLVGLPFSY